MAAANNIDAIALETISPTPVAAIENGPVPVGDVKQSDPFLVTFDQPYDVDNPQAWPKGRKWAITDVLSATGFNRILVSTIMAPALPTIAKELNMSSTESALSLSIYLLATAFGPLFIGPLSEIYGRQVILHASNIWFLAWNIACGFANTKELLIASRFLAGFGASAIYSLAGGVLNDLWRPQERGRSLSVYLLIPLLGAAVGPILGGFIAEYTTWRWMFWSTSIFQGVMIAVSFDVFRETFAPLILNRRVSRLRKETGNERYYTQYERQVSQQSVARVAAQALSRPLRLLAFHPLIQLTAIVSALGYGTLYIVISSFADLWTSYYHQPVAIGGLHYIACALGEIAGSQLGGQLMDALFRYMKARSNDGEHIPEFRIPLTLPGAIISPIGLFIYGWTAQARVHWIAVDIGIFINMFGGQLTGLALSAYVIDAYPEHTSSAIAATQFLKSLAAFLFPLFVPSLYGALGYGWGNSTIAFASLVLALPAPFVIWRYGARLRQRAASTY
ncbi:major facilitator superfamily domain-containing protein [Xylaria bambusicola]|uniref:major facilitator superfamily domain-containing protein n=1 Tax=Xylaria bambusicola TaxID=326684 RepID=UPI002007EEBD|nr:major facilitator superfamily domain-containing protein [Xylaria bambusicola]KAI0525396.1 major facilitator superfamily domain-containing protein [Xylaria bambusicola]